MTNIVQMKDSKGNNFYPKTHISAVFGYVDPQSELDQKVDKVEGYGLSKNDLTDEDVQKLNEIDNKQDAILTSPNGTKFKIIVNNDGTLATEQVIL